MATLPPKAGGADNLGRFREIVSDPLNLLIERDPCAGCVRKGMVRLHNGLQVPLRGEDAYYQGFSDVLVINRGVHEPLEEYLFQEVMRLMPEEPVMLELGAYWGHYSMWLQSLRPSASNWLVESDPTSLQAGMRNFARNGMRGQYIRAEMRQGGFTVDGFMAKRGLARLDMLHADIQGFELEMLQGAVRTLGGLRADYVFVSTHSAELHAGVRQGLAGHGYRIEASSDFELETTSFDGLVFASSPEKPQVFDGFAPLGREAICLSTAAERVQYVASVLQARAPHGVAGRGLSAVTAP